MKVSVRRLERAIDDYCQIGGGQGIATQSDFALLSAPTAAGIQSAKTLTSLSTFARIRCLERLNARPGDWLATGEDTGAHRHRFRERQAFWASRPSAILGTALFADALVGILIGTFGLVELRPVPATHTTLIVAFALVSCLRVNDFIKCFLLRRFRQT